MLLTIGYQYITPEQLRERAKALRAVVIDVRSSVKRTKAGFGSRQLQQLLGEGGYVHRPDLGGRGDGPTGDALGWLIGTVAGKELNGRNVLLLCQEGAPGECHRHHMIAGPRFPDALHIFDPGEGDEAVEVFTARELTAAISGDGTYAMTGWADFLASQGLADAPPQGLSIAPSVARAVVQPEQADDAQEGAREPRKARRADFLASQGLTDAPPPQQGLSIAPSVARAVVQPAAQEQADDDAALEGAREPRKARRADRQQAAARVATRRAQVTP